MRTTVEQKHFPITVVPGDKKSSGEKVIKINLYIYIVYLLKDFTVAIDFIA